MGKQRYTSRSNEPHEKSRNASGNQYMAKNQQSGGDSPVVNSLVVQKKAEEQAVILRSNNLIQQRKQQTTIQQSRIPVQRQENKTGLPEQLKSGIESLSGIAMDDVRVHRNSPKPAQLQAYAYAQGSEIHIGPGQEKHLPHEAWHVVQQKQGRVKPTMQLKESVPVNDEDALEKEADRMGAKAAQLKANSEGSLQNGSKVVGLVAQRQPQWKQNNHQDNLLDNFVAALDNLVQEGARNALQTPTALPGTDGYTQLWKDTADILVGLRDGDRQIDPNARASQIAQRLQNARYGYAVEAYASGHVDQLTQHLPNGYTYALQAGRGATRPDIIVKNAAGQDVAWFDITSDNNLGHIDLKTGAGWNNKPYVAEITYPAFDVTALYKGMISIGQGVATKNAFGRKQAHWNNFVNQKKQSFLGNFNGKFKYRDEPYPPRAVLQKNTKDALTDLFGINFTEMMAKNLLRSFGLNIINYGFRNGGKKADGDAFLSQLYQSQEEEGIV